MLTRMEPALDIVRRAASADPELGWSWQDIAGRLGVTKQTVHRKHGKRIGSR